MDRAKACEILNFYRNQHYTEPLGTEERELSDAINEILPHYAALREQEQKYDGPRYVLLSMPPADAQTIDTGVRPSNADRIRAMTDEELARFLAGVENRRSAAGGGAIWKGAAHAKEWLQQPVEEETK